MNTKGLKPHLINVVLETSTYARSLSWLSSDLNGGGSLEPKGNDKAIFTVSPFISTSMGSGHGAKNNNKKQKNPTPPYKTKQPPQPNKQKTKTKNKRTTTTKQIRNQLIISFNLSSQISVHNLLIYPAVLLTVGAPL